MIPRGLRVILEGLKRFQGYSTQGFSGASQRVSKGVSGALEGDYFPKEINILVLESKC